MFSWLHDLYIFCSRLVYLRVVSLTVAFIQSIVFNNVNLYNTKVNLFKLPQSGTKIHEMPVILGLL